MFSIVTSERIIAAGNARYDPDFAPLEKYGGHSNLRFSTFKGGSCLSASWDLAADIDLSVPALRPGRLVTIYEGLLPRWAGKVLEPQRDHPWHFNAVGLQADAANYLCVASNNARTKQYVFDPAAPAGVTEGQTPDKVIDYAIERGWRVCRAGSIPFPKGLPTQDVSVTIAEFLDQIAALAGQQWIVDEWRNLRFVTDETSPSFTGFPPGTPGGRIVDNYLTAVWVEYLDKADNGVITPVPKRATLVQDTSSVAGIAYGQVEAAVDLTGLGQMDLTITANKVPSSFGQNVLAQAKPQAGTSSEVVLTPGSTSWMGGRNGDYPRAGIKAGQMVLLRGAQVDLITGGLTPDMASKFTIAETDYDELTDTVVCKPTGFVARDLAPILAKAQDPATYGILPQRSIADGLTPTTPL